MTSSTPGAPAPQRLAGRLVPPLLGLIVAACGLSASVDAGDGPASPPASSSHLAATASPAVAPLTAIPLATAAPVATVSPAPTAASHPPGPTAKPDPVPPRRLFAMNLYRSGDYVAQFTNEWCVGASLQMTLNMTTAKTHTSRASQRTLWKMAQARSFSPFGGANPRGWTAALNDLGVGPYVLVSIPDFDEALRVAARAIRETKRPVGLVMWHGRHAWVMSGFESIGDPRIHDDITVTGVRVLDPLYPNGSAAWGRSPRPNALIKPSTLAKQFVVRDSSNSRVDLGVPPGFLLVLPTA
jgi:hypothetical protein